jgi:hypothetical protein
MTYYVGGEVSQNDLLGTDVPRYFYGLARDDNGTLYFYKIDQIASTSSLVVNAPGASSQNFSEFEYGVDFFDGRLASNHSRPYANLTFDQYRWDNKNIYYYIDTQGNFVASVNQQYTYDSTQILSS